MNTATICLGSNASDAPAHIARAVAFICTIASIRDDSGDYPSDPEHTATTAIYTNRILEIGTALHYDRLHSLCKKYESTERAATVEEARVTIDIDIVIFNGAVLRPLDHASAYFNKGLALLAASKSEVEEEDFAGEVADGETGSVGDGDIGFAAVGVHI